MDNDKCCPNCGYVSEVCVSDVVNDDLLDKIIEHISTLNTVTISMLQKKFNIGYARAVRIIEKLEDEKIISLPDRYGRRKVISKGRINE